MSDEKDSRLNIEKIVPKQGEVQLDAEHTWYFDKVPHALIAGHVGTGKTSLLFSIVGQLLTQTKYVDVVDVNRSELAMLSKLSEYSTHVVFSLAKAVKMINRFYNDMEIRSVDLFKKHALGTLGSYRDFEMLPHFLVIDEFRAFVLAGEALSFDDELYPFYRDAMRHLEEIALRGRALGFYLVISSVYPSADVLPMVIRNQMTLRINMGLLTPVIEEMMFPNDEKVLLSFSNDLRGLGFIQSGNEEVRSFFAPEIPKDFNLHDYIREQIAKREAV